MGFDHVNFETLLSLTGLTTEALSSMLMLLELENRITTLAGGRYQRLV
jgi:DNA processing protein